MSKASPVQIGLAEAAASHGATGNVTKVYFGANWIDVGTCQVNEIDGYAALKGLTANGSKFAIDVSSIVAVVKQ